jgi:hypothetical protein
MGIFIAFISGILARHYYPRFILWVFEEEDLPINVYKNKNTSPRIPRFVSREKLYARRPS